MKQENLVSNELLRVKLPPYEERSSVNSSLRRRANAANISFGIFVQR